jgi:hypothetical protein
VWTEGKSGNLAGEPMYIHFEFDNWRPWYMPRNLEDGKASITKMIPPGKS